MLKLTDKEIYIEKECSRRTARLICNRELAGDVRKQTDAEMLCVRSMEKNGRVFFAIQIIKGLPAAQLTVPYQSSWSCTSTLCGQIAQSGQSRKSQQNIKSCRYRLRSCEGEHNATFATMFTDYQSISFTCTTLQTTCGIQSLQCRKVRNMN
jgi:hypothetical protein